jgi:ABC-type glycerol-3-phosphate transport system permease component
MRSKTTSSDRASWFVKLGTVGALLFLYVPLLLIFLYSFTTEESAYTFPPPGLTLQWFPKALGNVAMQNALLLTLKVALLATALALVLGTLAAAAVYRFDFFGKNAISFMLILPLALPGIVTGIAHSLFVLDDRNRPRHVLRGGCLQQRIGAIPPHQQHHDRGLYGPRRELLPDILACHPSEHRHFAFGRRDPGLLPFL